MKAIQLKPNRLQLLRANAQEQQRKEIDVEIGQPILMDDVIYTNNL